MANRQKSPESRKKTGSTARMTEWRKQQLQRMRDDLRAEREKLFLQVALMKKLFRTASFFEVEIPQDLRDLPEASLISEMAADPEIAHKYETLFPEDFKSFRRA